MILCAPLWGQQGERLPVVLMNGYQIFCPTEESDTFGRFGPLLREDGYRVLFFNSCVAQNGPLETLGQRFASFVQQNNLQRFDVIAHSMGGLILRTYLSGKQPGDNVYNPPFPVPVRRAMFVGTPHGGTEFANALSTPVLEQIRLGGRTLWELGRWNQGQDDLREIEAIALVGTSTPPGDGVVNFTSAAFPGLPPSSQIAVPYCHTSENVLVRCNGALPIAAPQNREHLTYRIASSFLAGTNDWRSVGQNAQQGGSPFNVYGITAQVNDAQDQLLMTPASVYIGQTSNTPSRNGGLFFWQSLDRTAEASLTVLPQGQPARSYPQPRTLGTLMTLVKSGPALAAIASSAAALPTRSLAPGMLVSIYGTDLAPQVDQATSVPFPTQLSGTSVSIAGSPVGLHFVSSGQINAVLPQDASGVVPLTVQQPSGRATLNVMIEPAVPSLYSRGPVAAAVLSDGRILENGLAATAGDFVVLFGTGLGRTERRDGLDWAVIQPRLTIGGISVPLQFAGRSPEFPGVDQINLQIPSGIPAGRQSVVLTSGMRSSNVVSLDIR